MKTRLLLSVLFVMVIAVGCKKENNDIAGVETAVPVIKNLTADKYEIMVGGADPAILNCEADGGNLSYVWEVDLGDIFALNEAGSQVRFTGSECCIGEKIISCTVSNDKGSVTETITINILIP